MRVPLLDLKAQYHAIRDEIHRAVETVCEEQTFILGSRVEAFENHMATYCGAAQAIGVSSGSDALLVALMALGLGPGDGVLTTPYTFFATAGAIVRLGATPIFADIDPATFNLDPACCREVLRRPPERFKGLTIKAMIPVHLFGQMADMRPLLDLAAEYNMKVVEDAAQAIGAEYPWSGTPRKAGTLGTVGCFSFFPSKNLGGFGDGGMVVTNDDTLAERMRVLRNHGAKPKYHHAMVGGNFRLDALQAAVLDVKLRYLDTWHEKRRQNAARYDAAFAGTSLQPPPAVYRSSGLRNYHIYNQYVIRVPERDAVRTRLTAAGIGCEVYYPIPLHLQPCFASLGYQAGDFPESERAARETLALPIYPELTPTMQAEVTETILKESACQLPHS